MAYKLEVNHPDFPEGWPLNCDGILVENGGSTTITAEMEQAFLNKNGKTLKQIYGHSTIHKLSGTTELSGSKSKSNDEEGVN